MMFRSLSALAAAAGLAMTPFAGGAQVLLLPACGGAAHRLVVVPDDPGAPADQRDACSKACHAVTDRRGKAKDGKREGCC